MFGTKQRLYLSCVRLRGRRLRAIPHSHIQKKFAQSASAYYSPQISSPWFYFKRAQTRIGTIDNRAQRISDHNQCLTLVITTATMAMASVSPLTVTFRWRHYIVFQLFVLQMSSNIYTVHRFLLLLRIHSLSLFLSASSASNPNLSFDDHRYFSPGTGHFCRASSFTWSDRGADLWGTFGRTQGTLVCMPVQELGIRIWSWIKFRSDSRKCW